MKVGQQCILLPPSHSNFIVHRKLEGFTSSNSKKQRMTATSQYGQFREERFLIASPIGSTGLLDVQILEPIRC
jgi:hypothetical protein